MSRRGKTQHASVGDHVPHVELVEKDLNNKVDLADICEGKKVVVFGVPAGKGNLSEESGFLEAYLNRAEEMKRQGVDEILCVSVNDPHAMDLWGSEHHVESKVRMLSDHHGELTKALGLEQEHSGLLGGLRCKRFSMLVEDGKIIKLNVDPDGASGMTSSLPENLLDLSHAKEDSSTEHEDHAPHLGEAHHEEKHEENF